MKKWFWMTLATSALLLVVTGTALAENKAKALTLSPMVGGYMFEGNQNLDDSLTYGLGLGYNLTKNWGMELMVNYIDAETDEGPAIDVDGYLSRLDGLYHFRPDSSLVPYLAAGMGVITLDPSPGEGEDDFALNYGAGLKWFLSEAIALRGDVRHVFAPEEPNSNLIYTAGLLFQFGGEKEAAPAPVVVLVPKDSDGDGVIDANDRCPNTPPNVIVDALGCPKDSDGDGVVDYLDKCPNTPANVRVNVQGCPEDTDQDGVPDYLDQCPATPKGAPVDAKGCPKDSDGDGVFDYLDRCPDTGKGIMVDERGCELTFTLQIEFDVNQSDIRPEYHGKLAEAAAFIERYPAPQFLVVGHTDSTGAAEYNKQLSQRRAESVRQYLADNFDIDANKLIARGLGEEQPVADNATAEGRQQNRRVDITCCAVVPE